MAAIPVSDILKGMIESWPTLYATRLDALDRVFTESRHVYKDGGIIPEGWGEHKSTDDKLDEEKQVAEGGAKHYEKNNPAYAARVAAGDRLYARRENARIKFIRDNADLLALEEFSEFSHPPSFSTYELNRIELDKLNDEWKAALVEFCEALLKYDEKQIDRQLHKLTEEYRNRARTNLAEAKETARECLARLGKGPNAEATARAAVLAKLKSEAEKLGMKLVPIAG